MPVPGAGELNRKITIQSIEVTKGTLGGKVNGITTWLDNVSAKVVNLNGSERDATEGGGTFGEAKVIFTIRFRAGLSTTKHRIVYKGVIHNIRHINNFKEENRFLVITCDTVLSNG